MVLVAILELVAGLEGVGGVLWKIMVGGDAAPLPALPSALLAAFGILSLVAGGMLFIGSRASRALSAFVQGAQVVRLYSAWFGAPFATRGIEFNLVAAALLCVLVLPAFRERPAAAPSVPSPI
jgi:hypothetical protein